MAHTFFPWQEEAWLRIVGQPRIALFMEMRLGKTPLAIRWAQHWMETELRAAPARVLIIGPKPVLDDWQTELRVAGVRRRDIIPLYDITQAEREELAYGGARGWYLINYEGLRLNDAMAEMEWHVLICDESTAIRNPSAQITKRLIRDYAHVPYRAILTGDPVPEGPADYFSQFHFLHGSFMGAGNFWVFRQKWFRQSKWAEWDWQPKPGTRDAIKAFVHERAIVMLRSTYNVGSAKTYQRRVVEANAKQKDAIRQLTKDFSYEYIETNFATVRDVWLARIAGGFSPDRENPELLNDAKIREIIALKKGELKHEPIVVWFKFNEELQATVAALHKAKIDAVGVWGATPPADRHQIRKDFARGKFDVICAQVALGRFGWNLSRANTAIYYSNPLDRQSRAQSEDRIIHPSKKTPVVYIDLETRGSIDREVIQLQREKKVTARAFARRLNDAVRGQIRRTLGEDSKTKGRKSQADHSRPAARRRFPGQGEDPS